MAIPLDTPSSPRSERLLRSMEAERNRESEERFTGWAVIWTLFAFKMATVVIIWYASDGSAEANAFIAVTTWYWMLIPVVAASGLIAYRLRLRRVRRKVDMLRWSEFMGHPATDGSPVLIDDVQRLLSPEASREERNQPGNG